MPPPARTLRSAAFAFVIGDSPGVRLSAKAQSKARVMVVMGPTADGVGGPFRKVCHCAAASERAVAAVVPSPGCEMGLDLPGRAAQTGSEESTKEDEACFIC